MAQIGKCSNRVGCTLAYTDQEIRFEGAPVCPECGQPLTEITKQKKKGSKLWVLILIPVLFLAIAGIGFYAVERYVTPSPTPTPTATASVTVTPSGTATVTVTVTPAVTPATTPSPAQNEQSPAGGQQSPAPNTGGNPPQGQGSPNQGGSPNPQVTQKSPDTGGTTGQKVETKAKQLTAEEIEEIKQNVLARIRALPKMSQAEKSKLADKVQTAKSMERVVVVYFERGSNVLSRTEVDKLVTLFKSPELADKMSDPTLVFIVAGYADVGGDPRGNLKLSDERAQAVASVMSENAGVINLIRTVAMGGTELLSKRPDENRAVEIWAVIP